MKYVGTTNGKTLEAADLPGADAVASVLRGGSWCRLTVVWRLCFEFRVDEAGDLHRYLIMDLGEGFELDEAPLLRVEMRKPRAYSIPDGIQIIGLAIDDISEMRWEGVKYRIYDYEDSSIDILCESVCLKLQPNPEFL